MRVYECMYVSVYMYMYVYVLAYMHVCMYIYMCVYHHLEDYYCTSHTFNMINHTLSSPGYKCVYLIIII